MTGWYVHTVPVGAHPKALPALRHAGVEVIRLMCFQEVRAHPRVKKRRVDLRRAVPALDDYVFIAADGEAELSRISGLHKKLARMDWMGGPAPRLSAAGVDWLMHPPRGLFRDTELARYRDAETLRCGDHVRAWTPVFAGHEGEVISIRGRRARVQFEAAMFEIEVPVESLVVVTDPVARREVRA